MSIADSFRTRQAVRDLRKLLALAPAETRVRIAAEIPRSWIAADQARSAVQALTAGDTLAPDLRTETIPAVQKAAALPQDDFPTFICATCMLLCDVLEGATPATEIEHHWAMFRGHYRVAQAIRRISLMQDVPISMPQSLADRTTASAAALKPLLMARMPRGLAPPDEIEPGGVAAILVGALTSAGAVEDAARLWDQRGDLFLETMPDVIIAGFRYLYEAWDGFSPMSGPHLPVLDPPPGVEWPH